MVLNGIILFYLLRSMPRHRIVDVFSIIVFCLVIWQLEDCLLRLNITKEIALRIESYLSFSWLAIGALVCHFSGLFTGKKFVQTRVGLVLLYGPFFLFYIIYHSNPDPVILFHDDFWGYTLGMRERSLDLMQRYWIAGYVLWGLAMLFREAFDGENTAHKRKQALLIGVGVLIPASQGVITQLLFHTIGLNDLPLTSTFMTAFTIITWIALRKYKLFDISSLIEIEKIFHSLPSFVIVVSNEGKIIYSNLFAQRRLLNIDGQIAGQDVKPIFYDEGSFLMFKKVIDSEGSELSKVKNFKTAFLGRNGEQVSVLVTAMSVSRNQKQKACVLIANDISQWMKAEKAVKLAKEKYELVGKAANEAFWDRDLSGGLIRWGGSYFRLFGYDTDNEKLTIEEWESNIHPDDLMRVKDSIIRFLQMGNASKWQEEFRYKRKDGSYAWVLNKGYAIKNQQGLVVRMVGSMEDITKLRTYLERIENQNKEFSAIAHAQSHLVRAPLARIMGLVIHLQEFGVDSDDKELILESLVSSCEELDDQIKEVVRKTNNFNNL